jgi:hypothetical protein
MTERVFNPIAKNCALDLELRNKRGPTQFLPKFQSKEDPMINVKRLGAALVLSTLVAFPAFAQDARRDRMERRDDNPVDATVGAAAGVAGAAIGTAGAIATAPFRAPDNCPPGTFFTGPDGQQHPCR